ncbi:MAG: hypothetical protein C5B50_11990 [Verrucomicrobia bacterium]|nr:MAG: hypothetical protein C5B50_11990 [Verrucomicrobiota bacterium]
MLSVPLCLCGLNLLPEFGGPYTSVTMPLTPAQQQAIKARGNVLVVAGAGTGKTRTLVERCLDCLLEEKPPASLDQILMVTFTEAAAAEMRQRIRARLEEEARRDPRNPRWTEQLALFETAAIGTLHSFCLQLVRQHFYELELDPQVAVMAEEEAQVLQRETLDKLLEKHYAGRGPASEAVQELIQIQGGGSDKLIRTLVLRLHHYTQTRPDPKRWMDEQKVMFASREPERWREWFDEAIAGWRDQWLPFLSDLARHNPIAAKCAAALTNVEQASRLPPDHPTRSPGTPTLAKVFNLVLTALDDWPHGKKALWRDPLDEFADEVEFLSSLTEESNGLDPLTQDWEWIRSQMLTLLALAGEFTQEFSDAKRERGMVDFHDLEQLALQLLWSAESKELKPVAREWRDRLRFIFVDEYQDINAAQDKIIQAVSRDGTWSNRFLVGDVKQSIYRFRLAEPRIFQDYADSWGQGLVTSAPTAVIPLLANFRSREGILDFINSVFGSLMRREIGGVDYDEQARLQFGAAKERHPPASAAGNVPCVELLLRIKGGESAEDDETGPAAEQAEDEAPNPAAVAISDLKNAEKEARMIASRLIELKTQAHPIWDEEHNRFRPVEWSDIAILLRSPAAKAESYAKEFSRLNVPLLVERRGFYDSLEISDLLSLLQILDNPLQDLPLLAVLRSPLVGLTINELAEIRAEFPRLRLWAALLRWQEAHGPQSTVHSPRPEVHRPIFEVQSPKSKVQSQTASLHATCDSKHDGLTSPSPLHPRPSTLATFLDRFARWRRLARQASISRCLEIVLAETHYADWLLTQTRGEQRKANVQRLLGLTQQFDQFQRQGLLRFLNFIEAQRQAEVEPEVAAVSVENAVRLMSIHQSKGLEFPVVVVADLDKRFNLQDLRAEIILDEVYGLCPQIKPPVIAKRYPSLPFWLARRRQKKELLGEELRLLYVAMTRARDFLLLSTSVRASASFTSLPADLQRPCADSRPPILPLPVGEGRGEGNFSVATAHVPATQPLPLRELLSAGSQSDWLELWLTRHDIRNANSPKAGQSQLLCWRKYDEADLATTKPLSPSDGSPADFDADPAVWDALQQRLSWQYPFEPATRQVAKTSVSLLRRAAEDSQDAEEAASLYRPGPGFRVRKGHLQSEPDAVGRDSGFASGAVHHKYLQFVSLERTGSEESLKAEAERLQAERAFTLEEAALLDFEAIASFWRSDLGRKICSHAPLVRRELAFTARFSPEELSMMESAIATRHSSLVGEFVVIQGVADLVVMLPEELWLVDFKTDSVRGRELDERARAYEIQLKLYARALERIYKRLVSECWLYFLIAGKAVRVPVPTCRNSQ